MSYIIRNQYTIPGSYSNHFASQVKHLNEMLKTLRIRERQDRKWILRYVKSLPNEWEVIQSEWRMNNDYRNVSEFRAKQFARYLSENYGVELIAEAFTRNALKYVTTYRWEGTEEELQEHGFRLWDKKNHIYSRNENMVDVRSSTDTLVDWNDKSVKTIKETYNTWSYRNRVNSRTNVGGEYLGELILKGLVSEHEMLVPKDELPKES